MKAQESTGSTEQSLSNSSVSVLSAQNRLKCNEDKTVVQMCISEKCTQKNIFQCSDEECQCQQIHMNCKTGKLRPVISMINSKLNIAIPIKQAITSMITNKIDELSLLEEQLLTQVNQEFKNGQLTDLEQKFKQLFEGEKNRQFSSSSAEKIWNMATDESKNKNETLEEVKGFIKFFDEQIERSVVELRQKMNILAKKGRTSLDNVCEKFTEKSAIITSEQQSQTLMGMFSKKVKSLEYIFCASKNQFSMAKYYQIGGKLANTVIVCRTNMDKIIGAYTPLIHDEAPYYNYIEDVSGDSFIFSLTDKQKFTLKNKANAIYRYSKKSSINFGGQLYICNKSNQNKQCQSNVNNKNYSCPAYSVNDKAAYLKFNGNQTHLFSTKEWEVWKVQFGQR